MVVEQLWGSSTPYAPFASLMAPIYVMLDPYCDVSSAKQQLDWLHVQAEFEALVANEESSGEEEAMSFDSVVSSTTDEFETRLSRAPIYAQRLDTTAASSPMATFSSMGSTTLPMMYVVSRCSLTAIFNYGRLEFFEFTADGCRAGLSILPRKRAFPFLSCIVLVTLWLFHAGPFGCDYRR
jgi:hypothetical protein